MKFRHHRGSLAEAMETVVEVADMTELRAELERVHGSIGEITVRPYGWDKRIGWETHVVCIDRKAVGFTNGKL